MQRIGRAVDDDEFLRLLKAHVDHGFALIANDTNGFKSEDDYVDYLVELTRGGLEQRTLEAAPQIAATPAFGVVAQFANRLAQGNGRARGG